MESSIGMDLVGDPRLLSLPDEVAALLSVSYTGVTLWHRASAFTASQTRHPSGRRILVAENTEVCLIGDISMLLMLELKDCIVDAT